MTEPVFAADPLRLLIAAAAGILLLLLLIIKFKIHPVLSLLTAALVIGLGAGMPVPTLVSTVENGAGETLQGIILLIGLGSLFGGILEVSGGAQCVAQTLINKFGEKKAGIALGITGLVVGTTVFFEAGVVILIPLAFGLAKKTKKSTLYYVIPLLAGLATGFAFIPPSAGSVLVANMLNVDLGVMIAVGVPVGILSLIFAGILWSKFIGKKINTGLPSNIQEVREEEEANLPKFSTVLCIILVPLVLILCSTISEYIPGIDPVRPALQFLGTPFVALIIAVLFSMYFLGKKMGYNRRAVKEDHGPFPETNWSDPACDHRRWYHPMGPSGLRNGKYHRACPGKKRAPVSAGGIFDRSSDPCISWGGSCSHDHGSRNHGGHAGNCRTFPCVSGSNGLCHQRRRNGIQPCK